jgi:hypothetical protein
VGRGSGAGGLGGGSSGRRSAKIETISAFPIAPSTWAKPNSQPRTQKGPNEVGQISGDDLLLLATDREWRLSRRYPIESFMNRGDDDRANDTYAPSLFNEPLAAAFELWQ